MKKILVCFLVLCLFTTQVSGGISPAQAFPDTALVNLAQSINIPAVLGQVEEAYFSPNPSASSPVIVYLKDAHTNYEAQKRIQQILSELHLSYKFNLVAVEGAGAKLDPSYLKFYPEKEKNLKVAESLARDGEISGVDLFLLDQENAEASGIENVEDYAADLSAFRAVLSRADESRTFLEYLDAQIELVMPRLLDKDLLKLVKLWKGTGPQESELLAYVSLLTKEAERVLSVDLNQIEAQVEWPYLSRLSKLKELEGKLDPVAIEKDHARLTEFLKEINADPELIRQVEGLKNLKQQDHGDRNASAATWPPRLVHEKIFNAAASKGFSFQQYPAYSVFAQHLILQSEIDSKELFGEMTRLSDRLLETLAQKPEEKDTIRFLRDLKMLGRAFALELLRGEVREAESRKPEIAPLKMIERVNALKEAAKISNHKEDMAPAAQALGSVLGEAVRFYEVAERREADLVRNTLKLMREKKQDRAVMVTGGYHADGVKERLRKEGVSYLVVAPRITQLSAENRYSDIMLDRGSLPETAQLAPADKIQNPLSLYEAMAGRESAERRPLILLAHAVSAVKPEPADLVKAVENNPLLSDRLRAEPRLVDNVPVEVRVLNRRTGQTIVFRVTAETIKQETVSTVYRVFPAQTAARRTPAVQPLRAASLGAVVLPEDIEIVMKADNVDPALLSDLFRRLGLAEGREKDYPELIGQLRQRGLIRVFHAFLSRAPREPVRQAPPETAAAQQTAARLFELLSPFTETPLNELRTRLGAINTALAVRQDISGLTGLQNIFDNRELFPRSADRDLVREFIAFLREQAPASGEIRELVGLLETALAQAEDRLANAQTLPRAPDLRIDELQRNVRLVRDVLNETVSEPVRPAQSLGTQPLDLDKAVEAITSSYYVTEDLQIRADLRERLAADNRLPETEEILARIEDVLVQPGFDSKYKPVQTAGGRGPVPFGRLLKLVRDLRLAVAPPSAVSPFRRELEAARAGISGNPPDLSPLARLILGPAVTTPARTPAPDLGRRLRDEGATVPFREVVTRAIDLLGRPDILSRVPPIIPDNQLGVSPADLLKVLQAVQGSLPVEAPEPLPLLTEAIEGLERRPVDLTALVRLATSPEISGPTGRVPVPNLPEIVAQPKLLQVFRALVDRALRELERVEVVNALPRALQETGRPLQPEEFIALLKQIQGLLQLPPSAAVPSAVPQDLPARITEAREALKLSPAVFEPLQRLLVLPGLIDTVTLIPVTDLIALLRTTGALDQFRLLISEALERIPGREGFIAPVRAGDISVPPDVLVILRRFQAALQLPEQISAAARGPEVTAIAELVLNPQITREGTLLPADNLAQFLRGTGLFENFRRTLAAARERLGQGTQPPSVTANGRTLSLDELTTLLTRISDTLDEPVVDLAESVSRAARGLERQPLSLEPLAELALRPEIADLENLPAVLRAADVRQPFLLVIAQGLEKLAKAERQALPSAIPASGRVISPEELVQLLNRISGAVQAIGLPESIAEAVRGLEDRPVRWEPVAELALRPELTEGEIPSALEQPLRDLVARALENLPSLPQTVSLPGRTVSAEELTAILRRISSRFAPVPLSVQITEAAEGLDAQPVKWEPLAILVQRPEVTRPEVLRQAGVFEPFRLLINRALARAPQGIPALNVAGRPVTPEDLIARLRSIRQAIEPPADVPQLIAEAGRGLEKQPAEVEPLITLLRRPELISRAIAEALEPFRRVLARASEIVPQAASLGSATPADLPRPAASLGATLPADLPRLVARTTALIEIPGRITRAAEGLQSQPANFEALEELLKRPEIADLKNLPSFLRDANALSPFRDLISLALAKREIVPGELIEALDRIDASLPDLAGRTARAAEGLETQPPNFQPLADLISRPEIADLENLPAALRAADALEPFRRLVAAALEKLPKAGQGTVRLQGQPVTLEELVTRLERIQKAVQSPAPVPGLAEEVARAAKGISGQPLNPELLIKLVLRPEIVNLMTLSPVADLPEFLEASEVLTPFRELIAGALEKLPRAAQGTLPPSIPAGQRTLTPDTFVLLLARISQAIQLPDKMADAAQGIDNLESLLKLLLSPSIAQTPDLTLADDIPGTLRAAGILEPFRRVVAAALERIGAAPSVLRPVRIGRQTVTPEQITGLLRRLDETLRFEAGVREAARAIDANPRPLIDLVTSPLLIDEVTLTPLTNLSLLLRVSGTADVFRGLLSRALEKPAALPAQIPVGERSLSAERFTALLRRLSVLADFSRRAETAGETLKLQTLNIQILAEFLVNADTVDLPSLEPLPSLAGLLVQSGTLPAFRGVLSVLLAQLPRAIKTLPGRLTISGRAVTPQELIALLKRLEQSLVLPEALSEAEQGISALPVSAESFIRLITGPDVLDQSNLTPLENLPAVLEEAGVLGLFRQTVALALEKLPVAAKGVVPPKIEVGKEFLLRDQFFVLLRQISAALSLPSQVQTLRDNIETLVSNSAPLVRLLENPEIVNAAGLSPVENLPVLLRASGVFREFQTAIAEALERLANPGEGAVVPPIVLAGRTVAPEEIIHLLTRISQGIQAAERLEGPVPGLAQRVDEAAKGIEGTPIKIQPLVELVTNPELINVVTLSPRENLPAILYGAEVFAPFQRVLVRALERFQGADRGSVPPSIPVGGKRITPEQFITLLTRLSEAIRTPDLRLLVSAAGQGLRQTPPRVFTLAELVTLPIVTADRRPAPRLREELTRAEQFIPFTRVIARAQEVLPRAASLGSLPPRIETTRGVLTPAEIIGLVTDISAALKGPAGDVTTPSLPVLIARAQAGLKVEPVPDFTPLLELIALPQVLTAELAPAVNLVPGLEEVGVLSLFQRVIDSALLAFEKTGLAAALPKDLKVGQIPVTAERLKEILIQLSQALQSVPSVPGLRDRISEAVRALDETPARPQPLAELVTRPEFVNVTTLVPLENLPAVLQGAGVLPDFRKLISLAIAKLPLSALPPSLPVTGGAVTAEALVQLLARINERIAVPPSAEGIPSAVTLAAQGLLGTPLNIRPLVELVARPDITNPVTLGPAENLPPAVQSAPESFRRLILLAIEKLPKAEAAAVPPDFTLAGKPVKIDELVTLLTQISQALGPVPGLAQKTEEVARSFSAPAVDLPVNIQLLAELITRPELINEVTLNPVDNLPAVLQAANVFEPFRKLVQNALEQFARAEQGILPPALFAAGRIVTPEELIVLLTKINQTFGTPITVSGTAAAPGNLPSVSGAPEQVNLAAGAPEKVSLTTGAPETVPSAPALPGTISEGARAPEPVPSVPALLEKISETARGLETLPVTVQPLAELLTRPEVVPSGSLTPVPNLPAVLQGAKVFEAFRAVIAKGLEKLSGPDRGTIPPEIPATGRTLTPDQLLTLLIRTAKTLGLPVTVPEPLSPLAEQVLAAAQGVGALPVNIGPLAELVVRPDLFNAETGTPVQNLPVVLQQAGIFEPFQTAVAQGLEILSRPDSGITLPPVLVGGRPLSPEQFIALLTQYSQAVNVPAALPLEIPGLPAQIEAAVKGLDALPVNLQPLAEAVTRPEILNLATGQPVANLPAALQAAGVFEPFRAVIAQGLDRLPRADRGTVPPEIPAFGRTVTFDQLLNYLTQISQALQAPEGLPTALPPDLNENILQAARGLEAQPVNLTPLAQLFTRPEINDVTALSPVIEPLNALVTQALETLPKVDRASVPPAIFANGRSVTIDELISLAGTVAQAIKPLPVTGNAAPFLRLADIITANRVTLPPSGELSLASVPGPFIPAAVELASLFRPFTADAQGFQANVVSPLVRSGRFEDFQLAVAASLGVLARPEIIRQLPVDVAFPGGVLPRAEVVTVLTRANELLQAPLFEPVSLRELPGLVRDLADVFTAITPLPVEIQRLQNQIPVVPEAPAVAVETIETLQNRIQQFAVFFDRLTTIVNALTRIPDLPEPVQQAVQTINLLIQPVTPPTLITLTTGATQPVPAPVVVQVIQPQLVKIESGIRAILPILAQVPPLIDLIINTPNLPTVQPIPVLPKLPEPGEVFVRPPDRFPQFNFGRRRIPNAEQAFQIIERALREEKVGLQDITEVVRLAGGFAKAGYSREVTALLLELSFPELQLAKRLYDIGYLTAQESEFVELALQVYGPYFKLDKVNVGVVIYNFGNSLPDEEALGAILFPLKAKTKLYVRAVVYEWVDQGQVEKLAEWARSRLDLEGNPIGDRFDFMNTTRDRAPKFLGELPLQRRPGRDSKSLLDLVRTASAAVKTMVDLSRVTVYFGDQQVMLEASKRVSHEAWLVYPSLPVGSDRFWTELPYTALSLGLAAALRRELPEEKKNEFKPKGGLRQFVPNRRDLAQFLASWAANVRRLLQAA